MISNKYDKWSAIPWALKLFNKIENSGEVEKYRVINLNAIITGNVFASLSLIFFVN